MYRSGILAVVFVIVGAWDATAQEVGVGLGASGQVDDGDAALAVDLDAASGDLLAWRSLGLALGAGAEVDTDGAVWGGAGPILRLALTERWRLEGSVMAGLYEEGDGVDLGGAVNFRSRIGITYAVTPAWRVGVAFSHKSNAGIYDENPGVERFVAQVVYGF